jgi:hypothetical protein
MPRDRTDIDRLIVALGTREEKKERGAEITVTAPWVRTPASPLRVRRDAIVGGGPGGRSKL